MYPNRHQRSAHPGAHRSIERWPSMTHATQLLERLERVKPTGPRSWLARCPAHEDKSPSLSIREKDDGTVLINCFAGCGAINILNVLGLRWSALFPPNPGGSLQNPPRRSRIPARDLLEIISYEVSVVAAIAADMLAGNAVNETDWKRLSQAAARIGKARDHMQ